MSAPRSGLRPAHPSRRSRQGAEPHFLANARRARGMTLIEVMIAVLLLSFGLMGMLGLKLAGLKSTGMSNARAAASVCAADILDRLRANPVRALAGAYTIGLADAAPATPTGVAQVDLAQWRQRVRDNLPSGSGSVAVAADRSVRIVLQWSERVEQTAAPRTLSFTFDARL